ncbi:MAG TPA: tetratricopeptide repeat protein [Vicinamibacteria bacterium]|nr:tetratricopeptide repeat protein [Vicinamibacteria bacterium]
MKTWLTFVIASLVAGGAMAQQEQPGAQDFLAGQEAIKKNDYDAAIPAFEKALSANPELFASNYYLGWAYRAKQNWGKCGGNFDTFLKKVGSNQDAAEMIGHANREGGLCLARAENTQAIPLLEKAASAKPNDKEVQYMLGVALMRANREGPAEAAFGKVIQLDPALPNPYYFAGRINFNRQEWAKAEERLSKYLELKPDDTFSPDAHFMVGSVAIRMAEGSPDATAAQDKAISHLQQFLTAKPNAPQSAQAHYILGSLAAQRDDNARAKTHFQKYLELEPNGPQAEEVKKFLQDLQAGEGS